MKHSVESFTQGPETGHDFLTSPDTMSDVRKSPSPLISVGTGEGSAGADVHFKSKPDVQCEQIPEQPHKLRCETWSAMKLRNHYKAEETTHRNMLRRAKDRGHPVHEDFRDYRSFLSIILREIGPKPFPRATLDRINNDDLEYAPGKVRWADKSTQSNNRGVSLSFQSNGKQYTSAQLAKRQGVSQSAIHKRLSRGWTHDEWSPVIAHWPQRLQPPQTV
jgi:hypothetical protein